MKPVYYHDEAYVEWEESALFYKLQRAGLGLEFEQDVLTAKAALSLNPKIGVKTPYSSGSIRKYHLTRFPYSIFYREYTEHILVLAGSHDSRKPGYWINRMP